MTAEVIGTADQRWTEFLREVRHDIYHLPEYVEFASRHEGGVPGAFLAREGGAGILIPFLRRKLPASLGAPETWCDAASPYGYPSPLVHPASDLDQIETFLRAFFNHGREIGLVTAFLRFHPLLQIPLSVFSSHGSVVHHGRTVSVDLRCSQEMIRRNTRENHRRGINRLKREGFSVRAGDWNDLPAFISVYGETMQRLQADPFYRFKESYFVDLKTTLKEKLHLFSVISPEGGLAAAGLFTTVDGIVEYHLGGTADKYLSLAPFKLLVDWAINWARDSGYSALHLGGGLGGRDDSLFHFKAGFSPEHFDFHTCRFVIDSQNYQWLNNQASRPVPAVDEVASGFFPSYRAAY